MSKVNRFVAWCNKHHPLTNQLEGKLLHSRLLRKNIPATLVDKLDKRLHPTGQLTTRHHPVDMVHHLMVTKQNDRRDVVDT